MPSTGLSMSVLRSGFTTKKPQKKRTHTNLEACVQAWITQTGTESISSNSFFTNMRSLPCVKFVSARNRFRCRSHVQNLIQGNECMSLTNEWKPIYSVPVWIVQNCICIYTSTKCLNIWSRIWRFAIHVSVIRRVTIYAFECSSIRVLYAFAIGRREICAQSHTSNIMPISVIIGAALN